MDFGDILFSAMRQFPVGLPIRTHYNEVSALNLNKAHTPGAASGIVICIMYFILGVTQYFGTSYVSLYVSSFAFVDGLAVGLIMALNYVVTAVGQLIWGNLADKSWTKNRILFLVLGGIFLTTWPLILPNHQSIRTLLPSVMALNLFLLVPLTIFDAIVVENSQKSGLQFGTMRGFSSAGSAAAAFTLFAVGTLAAIRLQAKTGLEIMGISALLALIPLCLTPKVSGHAYGQKGKRMSEIRILLKNKRFLLLLIYAMFNFTCTGAYVAYFSIFYTSAEGLSSSLEIFNLYGALCIAWEAILVIVSGRIFRKKDIYWVFTWVSIMGAFRSLAAFLAPNPYVLMAGGIFQGLMFGPLWGRVAPFIGSIVHDEVRATAQAIWSIVFQGLGPALGALIGGVATRIVGLRGVFMVIACLHLLVAAAFIIPFRTQRAQDRAECAISAAKV
jgi:PPP family 3-phenylpropionic acid transporter